MASSYFTALRDVVNEAHKLYHGIQESAHKKFALPCTPEIHRLTCEDSHLRNAKVLPKNATDNS